MTSLVSDVSELPDRDLLVRLHNSYREFIAPDNRDPEIKQKFHALYKELLHRLVTPTKSEAISKLLDSKDFSGYDEQSMALLHEELTKSI